ncbi:MAG: hypothetical protein HC836_45250 [Richelia sp. RM2_1_2]|nr:hypothetical protein [Richelia sp. RM2_1_2]
MNTTPEKNLFYTNNTHEYLYSNHADILQDNYIYFPLEVDTEFTQNNLIDDVDGKFKSTTLTVQYRAIALETGTIFAHSENQSPRHPVCKHDVTLLDYLEQQGYEVSMSKEINLPADTAIIEFHLYAFFAVAELLRIFQGEYREDITRLITNPTSSQIEQGRRLRTSTTFGGKYYNWVEPSNWCLTINGRKFRVRISIKDTCAVQGTVGYAGFASNSGVELKYKDNFTNAEKAHMDIMYNQRTEDFDNYALGDLHNHTILIKNMEKMETIYNTLGLSKHFTPPRLTIGSTVSKLLEAAIINLFEGTSETKDIISTYCSDGCADTLKRITNRTACLNAKVDGGRCRNNKPTTTYLMVRYVILIYPVAMARDYALNYIL